MTDPAALRGCPDPVWRGSEGSPSLQAAAVLCHGHTAPRLSCPLAVPGFCSPLSPTGSRMVSGRPGPAAATVPCRPRSFFCQCPLRGAGKQLGWLSLSSWEQTHDNPEPQGWAGLNLGLLAGSGERVKRSQRHLCRKLLCPLHRWHTGHGLFPPLCSSTSPTLQRRSGYFYFRPKLTLFASGLSRGVWASFEFTFWAACLFSKPAPVLGD